MHSLSTYWNSHRHNEDGLHMVHEALLLGFKFLELGPALPPVLLPGFYRIIEKNEQRKKPLIRISSVHGFCTVTDEDSGEYSFTSPQAPHREHAIGLAKKSIDLSADLKGKYVTLPLGCTPVKKHTDNLGALVKEGKLYDKSYAALKVEMVREREGLGGEHLDRVRKALDVLVPYAQEKGIRLGLESRGQYEQVPNEREMETLLAEYDTPTVGYWHSFGHVQMKDNLGLLDHRQYLEKMAPRLVGCYIHDVVWPTDDHAIPFHGSIDFDQLVPLLPKGIPLVWEMDSRRKSDEIKEALTIWKEKYGD